MQNIKYSVVSILVLLFVLQQCFDGDCRKPDKKNEQQFDHKHDPVNCNHPSHKHDHAGHDHSDHDHSGHENHKPGTTRTKTGPVRTGASRPRSLHPSAIIYAPFRPRSKASDIDVKDRHADDIKHDY